MATACDDKNCPKHGELSTRGAVREGIVKSTKAKKMAVIEIPHLAKVLKYERFEKRRSKLHAHVPPCIEVNEGDRVRAEECRKLSKTKNFVVTFNVTSQKALGE
ncbi:MAG TPA: 30S ribosomal protein S17 [Candidatus Norongarragalinales archaeon]|jgi:small subunit ribosomal protein S17|nr:30S ribosomal protein S17 [Candidatus Norongarragalinales archaeon]